MYNNQVVIMEKKEYFLACISDAVSDLVYYDRKDCEELNRDQVDELINSGEVTVSEMLETFKKGILENYPQAKI